MFSCTQSTQGKCSQMLHIFPLSLSPYAVTKRLVPSSRKKRGAVLPCEYDLSRYKDKQHNFWLHHTIYQPRKELRFILKHGTLILINDNEGVAAHTLQ